MSKFVKKFFALTGKFLAPPESKNSEIPSEKKRLLSSFIMTSIIIHLFTVIKLLFAANYEPAILISISGTACLVVGLYYKNFGNHRLCSYGFIMISVLSVSINAYLAGGLQSSTILWLLILPIVTSSFLESRDGLVITVIALFSSGAFFLYTYNFPPSQNFAAGHELTTYFVNFFGILLVCGYVVFHSNKIFKKARLEISSTNELLEKSLEHNRELVRILCHDIANPLTVAFSYAEIIEKKTGLEEARRIIRACEIQKTLLEEVRELEAVSSGKRTVVLERVCFDEVLEQSKFMFGGKMAEKDINLEVKNNTGEKVYFEANLSGFTNHVFNNILSNAIKFSHTGSKITIVLDDVDEFIRISVSDQGVGMPSDILSWLFDSRAKTSRKGTAGESGTGFGMPLAKSYMEKFGGKMGAESRCIKSYPDDHGTTFHLSLVPVAREKFKKAI